MKANNIRPKKGWMNDPNGMIYWGGKHHLFFQHNPYSTEWGLMHWGHFWSDDLCEWSERDIALTPEFDYERDGCYSGTAIEKDGELYLMYTSVKGRRQTQSLAYSSCGEVFKKHEGNPVIAKPPFWIRKYDFRDPKVFYDKGYYCMIGARTKLGGGRILLYKSQDLLSWQYVGVVLKGKGMFECPDYFSLDGKEVIIFSKVDKKRWSTGYVIGKLDKNTAKFEVESQGNFDMCEDFYAPQTLKDSQGRRIMIAWAASWKNPPKPINGSAGQMTEPYLLKIEGKQLKVYLLT